MPPPVTPNTVGKVITVTLAVLFAQLGDALLVKVKLVLPELANVNAVPEYVPVTVLPLTVATEVPLLTHVPPLAGDRVVVVPLQNVVGPVMLTTGKAVTCTADVVTEQFGAADMVKVKVALPGPTGVTVVPLTVATDGLLATQVPA